MKISIITVNLNNQVGLEATIKSVINQTYDNLEYIIIDGGSNDDSQKIVKFYQKKFPIIFISEKDKGIYDAMNKGIILSTGKYLNFMNSGDYFFNSHVVAKVIPFLNEQYDIIYGNVEVRYKNFKSIKKEVKPKYLWMGPVNHQSSFIKATTMRKYKYNINNKIVADFEFFLNVYYNQGKIKKINQIIASFANNGLSQNKDKEVITDSYKTIKKFKNNITIKVYYKLLMIKPILKKIIPKKIFRLIINIKNK